MNDTADKLRSLAIDRVDRAGGVGRKYRAWVVASAAAVLIAGASLLVLLLGARSSTAAAPAPAAAASAAPVSPAPAVAPRSGQLVASGYVTARTEATAAAEITGRILEVRVEEGDVVKAGDVLARLDDTRAKIDLDLDKAQSAAALAAADQIAADLAEARRVLVRTETLQKTASSEADLTAARAKVENLDAQLRRAKAQADAAQLTVANQTDYVDRHLIRAPFDGVVIARNAQAGEIISPVSAGGAFTRTGVATIVDMRSLEIEVDVNEGSIGQVKPGQPVEAVLDAYPDWRIPAHVKAIIPTADRSKATIKVRISFDKLDPRVFPDMAARVTFVGG
jgi:RND family efflux transporter MFP subunit